MQDNIEIREWVAGNLYLRKIKSVYPNYSEILNPLSIFKGKKKLINAFATKSNIVICDGLDDLIHKASFCLANIPSSNPNCLQEYVFSNEFIDALIYDTKLPEPIDYIPFFDLIHGESFQVQWGNFIDCIYLFIISHELAHIIFDHSKLSNKNTLVKQASENMADRFAIETAYKLNVGFWVLFAIQSFFIPFIKYEASVNAPFYIRSHPYSYRRMINLYIWAKELTNNFSIDQREVEYIELLKGSFVQDYGYQIANLDESVFIDNANFFVLNQTFFNRETDADHFEIAYKQIDKVIDIDIFVVSVSYFFPKGQTKLEEFDVYEQGGFIKNFEYTLLLPWEEKSISAQISISEVRKHIV